MMYAFVWEKKSGTLQHDDEQMGFFIKRGKFSYAVVIVVAGLNTILDFILGDMKTQWKQKYTTTFLWTFLFHCIAKI